MRHQALQWLFWNVDLTYAHARSGTDDANQEYIPLAPPFTLTGGVDFKHPSGLFGGTKFRMLTQRPGNEDYSIALEAYQIVDFNVGYAWNNVVLAINVQNLLNSAWKETQFVTNSRLQDETVAVEEIHFIPGTPRNMKFSLSYNF
jgi:outer membrane receptor for ferric coprogen and ferric-rhodotorulic acid